MPWKHMDVACAECGKQVRSRPCEVVSHTPGKKGSRPVWVLRCPYCEGIFVHSKPLDEYRRLRGIGVPKEVVQDLRWSIIQPFINVAANPHTESALQSAIDEMKNQYDRRVNFIGKDGVFVDDVLYMKKPK